MVEHQSSTLDHVFHALANPARRAILRRLASGRQNIGELAAPLQMSFAAASKHIRVLEGARLVSRKIEGRSHICALEPSALAEADKWLRFYEGFWTGKLDALDALLSAEDRASVRTGAGKRR